LKSEYNIIVKLLVLPSLYYRCSLHGLHLFSFPKHNKCKKYYRLRMLEKMIPDEVEYNKGKGKE